MRTVRWAEFQTLPAGTVYQEYCPDYLERPQVLQDFIQGNDGQVIDFFVSWLLPERGHMDDRTVESASSMGRDGVFDHTNGQWVVWEADDLARMAGWLLDPARMLRELRWDKPATCEIEPMVGR